MDPRLLALPAASLLVLGLAAPAGAAVTVTGSYVSGDDLVNTITLTCAGGQLTDTLSGDTGDPCAGLQTISVFPRNGSDTVDLSGLTSTALPALHSIRVGVAEDGTPEPDTVTGSIFEDTIEGDDRDFANGGAGDDSIKGVSTAIGGTGDDTFSDIFDSASGGEGDDRFVQFASPGGIDGGPGHDSWEIQFDLLQASLPISAVFTLTASGLDVVAGASHVTVPIIGVEHAAIAALRGGEQTVDGSAFPGTLHLRGLGGPDNLVGGDHDDVLMGGSGNDVLTGGPGLDLVVGGVGDDRVEARDGLVDRVDCGEGADIVVADAADVLTGCEDVQVPSVPSAPPAPPAPPAAPTPPVPPVAPAPAVVPDTRAVKGPKVVTGPKARFRFSSATAGATFECRVDGRKWRPCASPAKVVTKKLERGKHLFRVRAVLAGQVDPTPSRVRFKVR